MSFGSCACPLPTAVGSIPVVTCGEDLGQIQKIILQRRQSTPPFTALTGANSPVMLASWTPLLAAADSTKVTLTPFVEGFVIPVGDAITEGGDDNSTLDGNPIVVGATSIQCSGMFRSLPAAVIKALKAFNCELDLCVFFVNEFGKIIGDNPSGNNVQGFPITSFFVGDAGNEGKNTNDKTPIKFNLRYGWRDNMKIFTPTDFNARYDLVNA